MIDNILIVFFLFTGSLSLLTAIGQLIVKEKRFENINLFLLFICLTLQLFQICLILSNYTLAYPVLFFLHLTIFYLLGPVLFWAYFLVSIRDSNIPLKKRFLLLPTLIVLIFDLIFLFLPPNEKLTILRYLIFQEPYRYSFLIDSLFAGAGIQCVLYLSYLTIELVRRKIKGNQVNILSITIGYTILSASGMLLLIIGYVFSSMTIVKWTAFYISILIIGAFLIGQRYPEFLQLVIIDAVNKRYTRSRLDGVDIKNLTNRLSSIMDEEKAFADEDISLQSLARELQITPHQLSEFLNEHIELNFKSYINYKRVKEAMKLLIEEPERSIISISNAVGFNSKSSFYDSFSRFTGKTPNQYRKELL